MFCHFPTEIEISFSFQKLTLTFSMVCCCIFLVNIHFSSGDSFQVWESANQFHHGVKHSGTFKIFCNSDCIFGQKQRNFSYQDFLGKQPILDPKIAFCCFLGESNEASKLTLFFTSRSRLFTDFYILCVDFWVNSSNYLNKVFFLLFIREQKMCWVLSNILTKLSNIASQTDQPNVKEVNSD